MSGDKPPRGRSDERLGGQLTRRELMGRAAAMGVSAAAAVTFARSASAQVRAVVAAPLRIESAWGSTPKVLTTWKFRIIVPRDLMGAALRVTGTGEFSEGPDGLWRADFAAPGANTLEVTALRRPTQRTATLHVWAKDAALYARVGSRVRGSVALGCPACPHQVTGVFQTGAGDLLLDGLPAVYVGCQCSFAPSCGTNVSFLADGDGDVLYNGKALGVVGSRVGQGSVSGQIASI